MIIVVGITQCPPPTTHLMIIGHVTHMAKSCSLFYSFNMNIHDIVEPRDIFFQQHWEEYYFFQLEKNP